jgi:hypothetical protein
VAVDTSERVFMVVGSRGMAERSRCGCSRRRKQKTALLARLGAEGTARDAREEYNRGYAFNNEHQSVMTLGHHGLVFVQSVFTQGEHALALSFPARFTPSVIPPSAITL